MLYYKQLPLGAAVVSVGAVRCMQESSRVESSLMPVPAHVLMKAFWANRRPTVLNGNKAVPAHFLSTRLFEESKIHGKAPAEASQRFPGLKRSVTKLQIMISDI